MLNRLPGGACSGAVLLAGAGMTAANAAVPPRRALEVPCMCQSDLKKAVTAQREVPAAVQEAAGEGWPKNIEFRLYHAGYRPVRYDSHDYWCRIEPETGSRIAPHVRCVLAHDLEDEYRQNQFL